MMCMSLSSETLTTPFSWSPLDYGFVQSTGYKVEVTSLPDYYVQ